METVILGTFFVAGFFWLFSFWFLFILSRVPTTGASCLFLTILSTFQIKVIDFAPPVIICPRSYNFTMSTGSDYAVLRFSASSHPIEVIGPHRELQVTYTPDMVKAPPNR